MPLSLDDLVFNGTLAPEMAATLAAAAQERRSMLFVAVPRMAGKSTVMHATLAEAPASTPLHAVSRLAGRSLDIPEVGDGGYLVLSEVSPAGFPDYLWGREAQQVFEALPRGFSLATALHAGSVDEAFAVLGYYNGIPDDLAGRIDLMTYIVSLGPWYQPRRRVVAGLFEIGAVVDARPLARLLHRWDAERDAFEVVAEPERIGTAGADLAALRRRFAGLAGQP